MTARQPTPFGRSESDELVMAHLARIGVDPVIVLGYEIRRSPQESRLILELWFDDSPAEHSAPAE